MLLTLNIFEPRYRLMLRDLADREPDDRAFGVLAIKAGHEVGVGAVQAMHEVGTRAVIRQARSLGGGRFLVVGLGRERFRVTRVLDDDATPYARGEVEYLPEPDEDLESAAMVDLADSVSATFCALLDECGLTVPQLPVEAAELSYFVAANAPVDLAQRQRLLEVPGASERLTAEATMLHRERQLRARFSAAPEPGPLPPSSAN